MFEIMRKGNATIRNAVKKLVLIEYQENYRKLKMESKMRN